MLLLFLIDTALGACPQPVYQDDLQQALSQAEEARVSGAPARFEAAMREVEALLGCVREPLEAAQAEDLHRLHGLLRHAAGQDGEAVPYLAASRWDDASDRTVALAERVDAWEAPEGPTLPPPVRGRLLVDGQSLDLRPSPGEPYLFQRVVGERVAGTWYIHPGERTPRYPRLRQRLALVGGVGVGLSAGLVLAAELERQRLTAPRDTPLTVEELEGIQRRNHGFLVGAATVGGVAAASGAVLGLSYVW